MATALPREGLIRETAEQAVFIGPTKQRLRLKKIERPTWRRHPQYMSGSSNAVPRKFINGGTCLKRSLRSRAALIALGVLFVAPGFGGKVQSWPGRDADFSYYHTYSWLPVRVLTKSGVLENDDVAAPLIRQAVNRQLSQTGLTEVAQGGDLEVSAAALTASIPQVEAVIIPSGAASLDYYEPIATIGRYNKEGTLVVNLIIAGTKKSAWLGMAKESIDNKPGGGLKKIDKAATAMFKKYPKYTPAK